MSASQQVGVGMVVVCMLVVLVCLIAMLFIGVDE